ncbi:MAG: hypothetical protein ACLSAF_21480 [Intestinimonas sp.]
MAGIAAFSGRVHDWLWGGFRFPKEKKRLRRLPGALCHGAVTSLSTTVGALTFTIPLAAGYFGSLSRPHHLRICCVCLWWRWPPAGAACGPAGPVQPGAGGGGRNGGGPAGAAASPAHTWASPRSRLPVLRWRADISGRG